jgi:hypothetical protein
MKNIFYLVVFLVLISSSCSDNDNKTRFEGIILTDGSGPPIGTKGSRDLNDWKQDSGLPREIIELMDIPHGEDISNTDYAIIDIMGYPNPVSTSAFVHFDIQGGPCLLKVVIVDEDFEVKYRSPVRVTGTTNYGFDFSDETRFPNHSIVRVYYSFSQKDDDHFYVGHGDFWICRDTICN